MSRPESPGAEKYLNVRTPVHEHGYVSLVDYHGNDEAIVSAARHSYGGGTKQVSSSENLINYLFRHRHTSPFEQAGMTFDIKLPLFVNQQWIRHRTASLNQVSARYSVMPEEFYVPGPEYLGLQSKDNKQGTEGVMDPEAYNTFRQSIEEHHSNAYALYNQMLEAGVSREQARIVLPTSLYTRIVWKMDIHNLLHFLKLRTHPHAQREIRDYAEAIEAVVKEAFPLTYSAFFNYSKKSMQLSLKEQSAIKLGFKEQSATKCFGSQRETDEFLEKMKLLGLWD